MLLLSSLEDEQHYHPQMEDLKLLNGIITSSTCKVEYNP